ncbi:MAG: hypothetical protein HY866_04965 [Chloroflexi bacterium]|nr:hypothetical protein [Chloroflexota bacterium]
MAATVKQGKVIFRRWNKQFGLDETATSFSSLEELFELCLQTNDPMLVDRVTIEGTDENNTPRIVTLSFQSVTVPESGKPDKKK